MSEKVLGYVGIGEILFLTSDRVIVGKAQEAAVEEKMKKTMKKKKKRFSFGSLFGAAGGAVEGAVDVYKAKKKQEEVGDPYAPYLKMSPEDLLKAGKDNYAIPNSKITKVELKILSDTQELNIITDEKEYRWRGWVVWVDPRKTLEDYEDLLRLAFPDKLSIKKM